MDGPIYDSSKWTALSDAEMLLPRTRLRRKPLLDLTPPEQRAAIGACVLLMITPPMSAPWAVWLVTISSPDALSHAPSPTAFAYGVALIGFVLWLLACSSLRFARTLTVIAGLGWIASLGGCVSYVAGGIVDHHLARSEAPKRAHIVGFEQANRHTSAAIVELQGGERLRANSYPGGGSRCFLVQKVTGPHGFVWLRWLDGSPAPGPGQLAWPLDLRKCFSATPLAEIHD